MVVESFEARVRIAYVIHDASNDVPPAALFTFFARDEAGLTIELVLDLEYCSKTPGDFGCFKSAPKMPADPGIDLDGRRIGVNERADCVKEYRSRTHYTSTCPTPRHDSAGRPRCPGAPPPPR